MLTSEQNRDYIIDKAIDNLPIKDRLLAQNDLFTIGLKMAEQRGIANDGYFDADVAINSAIEKWYYNDTDYNGCEDYALTSYRSHVSYGLRKYVDFKNQLRNTMRDYNVMAIEERAAVIEETDAFRDLAASWDLGKLVKALPPTLREAVIYRLQWATFPNPAWRRRYNRAVQAMRSLANNYPLEFRLIEA